MGLRTGMLSLLLAVFAALLLPPPISHSEADAPSGGLRALGPDGAELGGCPLEHTEVASEISGFVARTTVTQVFRNVFPDPIEAIYTFPLGEQGAVDSMRIRTEGREIRGEIKRRAEARRIYENARDAGQLAALLDEERKNIFTQTIANLMPNAVVEVEIRYVETLRYEDGSFEWSFPMVVGPRFIPPGVPDADRISPPVAAENTRAGHDVSLAIEIDAGVSIESIDSRLHAVDIERPTGNRASVRLRNQRTIPNRDFVLRYAVAGDEIKSGVLTHRSGGNGYATFILVPPRRVAAREAAPKELIFVIDRSGSQSGLPLLKAKETMLWTLEHLNPNDTFQIVSFSSTTQKLFASPRLASADAVRKARTYVEQLEANGGTMMADAVREVCAEPAPGNRLRIVTLMTDGYIGNDYTVIDLVKRLRGRSRWFPFGTGNSTNRFLLDQIARHGGGEVEYVLLSEDGDRVARKFYDRIALPVLTDIRLEFDGLDVVDVMPYDLSDLWAQKPLIVHARYDRPGVGAVVLRGYQGEHRYEERLEVELPNEREANPGIASMWARARVDHLMARDLQAAQSGTFPRALEDEITRVALAHSLLTPLTSFVAVEDRVINENGTSRTVTVPVELPHGVDREGVLGSDRADAFAYQLQSGTMRRELARGRHAQNAPVRAAPEALAFSAVAEQEQKRPKLKSAALEKLGPHLRALVEGRVPSMPYSYGADGSISVRVKVARSGAAALAELEEVGLRISITTDRSVVGSITLEKLSELLELDFVSEVQLV